MTGQGIVRTHGGSKTDSRKRYDGPLPLEHDPHAIDLKTLWLVWQLRRLSNERLPLGSWK